MKKQVFGERGNNFIAHLVFFLILNTKENVVCECDAVIKLAFFHLKKNVVLHPQAIHLFFFIALPSVSSAYQNRFFFSRISVGALLSSVEGRSHENEMVHLVSPRSMYFFFSLLWFLPRRHGVIASLLRHISFR